MGHGMQRTNPIRRLFTTNVNSASFPSKIYTITEPVNDGVLKLTDGVGMGIPERIQIWPLGLGSDDDVSSMRVIGWQRVMQDTLTTGWIPTILGEWVCTFSAAVGVAGSAVLNTERFADTIVPVAARQPDYTIAAGTAIGSGVKVCSPTADLIGHIVMPIGGYEKLEFTFDQTTGTSTSNVLYKLLDGEPT